MAKANSAETDCDCVKSTIYTNLKVSPRVCAGSIEEDVETQKSSNYQQSTYQVRKTGTHSDFMEVRAKA